MKRQVAIAFILCNASAVYAADTVPLRMNIAPGATWKVDSTQATTTKMQATSNGQTQPFNTKSNEVRSATAEVLAVANGVPTSMRLTFTKDCAVTNDFNGQSTTVPFPYAGATVTVTRAADGTVHDDFTGQAPPDSVADLHTILDADAVVMPPHAVAVGDEWPGDPATVGRVLQLNGRDTGGMTLKLLSVKSVDGRPTAEVKVSFAANKLQGGINGKIVAQGVELVDLATGHAIKSDFSGTLDLAGQQQGQGPDGNPATYDIAGSGTITIGLASPMNAAGPSPLPGPAPAPADAANPLSPAPVAAFGGSFTDGKLKVDLQPQGDGYQGVFALGGQSFPVTATAKEGALTGAFTAGGKTFPFQASLDGDTLNLTSGATTYHLKKAVANPLDAPNPLAPHSDARPLPRENADRIRLDVYSYEPPHDAG